MWAYSGGDIFGNGVLFDHLRYGLSRLSDTVSSPRKQKTLFLKKILYFSKKCFSYILECNFSTPCPEKNNPEKKFIYFLYFGMNAEQRQNQKLFSYSRMTAD